MKTHKLLICMLSTTLVLPSYSVNTIHAETNHTSSDTPTLESPSLETSNDTHASDEKPKAEQNKDDKHQTSSKSKKGNASKKTSSSLFPSLLDTFNDPFDVFKAPERPTHFWDNWLTLEQPSNDISKDTHNDTAQAPTSTTSSPEETMTTETDTAQETPSLETDTSTAPSTSETPQDNSHLSDEDQAVANELDNISNTIQSNEPTDTSNETPSTESPDASHKETPSTESPNANEDRSIDNHAKNNDHATSSQDRVDDALLDAYGKDKNDDKDHTTVTESHQKDAKKEETTQLNPQLPTQKDIAHSDTPKQSFDDNLKASNFRSRATFETLPNTSSASTDAHAYIITENKDTRSFIKNIAKDAHDIGQKENIFASVMIAQAILESDSGNSALARAPHYNLFGIKGAYRGHSTTFNTLEDNGSALYQISAPFRSYPDEKASLQDYADLIKNGIDGNPYIYQPAWKQQAETYKDATAHLATTYATDTHYADKLNSIIKHYNLTQFDYASMPDLSTYTASHDVSSSNFKPFTEAAGDATYPQGQCTWYVYNRMAQFGLHISGQLGDAHNWDQRAAEKGYSVRSIPAKHSAVVFEPGQLGADTYYGHVAFVEKVNSDGSIVISESNVKGLGVISYRTIDASDAESLSYIKGE